MEQKLNDLQSKVIVGGVNLVFVFVLGKSHSLNMFRSAVGKGRRTGEVTRGVKTKAGETTTKRRRNEKTITEI